VLVLDGKRLTGVGEDARTSSNVGAQELAADALARASARRLPRRYAARGVHVMWFVAPSARPKDLGDRGTARM